MNRYNKIYFPLSKIGIQSLSFIGPISRFTKKSYACLLCILILQSSSIALVQSNTRIYGQVLDKSNGIPVENTLIFLEPGNHFAESDEKGNYEISDISPGSYQIVIQRVGYDLTMDQRIELSSDEVKRIDLYLSEKIYSISDAIIITATRGKSTSMEVPQSTDIISPERILIVSPLNVSEVLQNIQGMYIKDYGGFSALKSISLRGSSAAQVLIMLNGQRLNDPQTGEIDLSTLPLEGIERVEILRGGSSAIYGADAVGGVVNMITGKKQKSNGLDASLKFFDGSFNTNLYNGSVGYVNNWMKGSMGIKRVHSKGDFTFNDSLGNEIQRENNDMSSSTVFSEFKFEFGDSSYKSHLDLNYRYFTSERGAPGSIEFPSLTARQWDTYQHFQTMLRGKLFNILNSYQINGFWHWNKSRFEETEGFFAVDARNKSGNYGLETHARSVITPHHALTYGIGLRNEWMMSNQFSNDHNRKVYYLFIQNESNFDSKIGKFPLTIEVIPAIRLDKYSDFGSRWSPKIGSGFNFGSEWQTTLKLNAGWSYRTPTFNQLYWPKSAWSSGNPDLKPESGFDWDLGLNTRYPKFFNLGFDIVYFDIRMKDLIQWQTDSQFFSMPVNVDKARNRGVEIKSSLQILQDLVNINTNYTYLDARNQSDSGLYNKFLVYRSRHSFNSTLKLIWKSLIVGLDYRYVGSRYTDEENNPKFELNPYDLLDFTIRFKPIYSKLQPTLVFQIKNIFNEQNDIIKNYPVPGREFRLSLEITYN